MTYEEWKQLEVGDTIKAIGTTEDFYVVAERIDSDGVDSETGRKETYRDLACIYRGWERCDIGETFTLEAGECGYYEKVHPLREGTVAHVE
jgi:hypothetical protein